MRDVCVEYETGRKVLRDLTLALQPGEKVALLGLNGSGKTTALASVVGLVPHSGEIRVGGTILSEATLSSVRSRVGFVFNVPEDQILFPTPWEDVAFALTRKGVPRSDARARAAWMLEQVGLAGMEDVDVHKLSHGQKQRVALAGALISSPELLVLDEPSAGLDPPGKQQLAGLLSRQEAAVLVASHDIEFLASVCGRYAILEDGAVRAQPESAVWKDILSRW